MRDHKKGNAWPNYSIQRRADNSIRHTMAPGIVPGSARDCSEAEWRRWRTTNWPNTC